MTHRPTQIAVVDDHPLLREGVIHTLGMTDDFKVVGEGASGSDALRIARDVEPDLMLLDVRMPGNGVEVAKAILAMRRPIKVVMLTVSEDEMQVRACLVAGVSGYILKGVSGAELVTILRRIADGERYISPALAARILATPITGAALSSVRATPAVLAEMQAAMPLDTLSDREQAIMKLVVHGLSNREIGIELDLTEKTVKHYLTIIFRKLSVRNRTEAAMHFQAISA